MVELIIGLAFTIMSLILFAVFYFVGGEITVNGEIVSQEEFNTMLMPKLAISIFLIVGICLLIRAITKIIENKKTDTRGIETYGLIIQTKPSGSYINDVPVMTGAFATVIDNNVRIIWESVGLDCKNGNVGDCMVVKYYNNDINIVAPITYEYIPMEAQNLLNPFYEKIKLREKKPTHYQSGLNNDGRIY